MPTAPWNGTVLQQQPRRVTSPLVPVMRRVQESPILEGLGTLVGRVADRVTMDGRASDALRGTWFGHALHPLLTDLPLGAWMCTSLLDLFGGPESRPAAEGLLAFGVVTAAPTAVTGLAEWRATEEPARRVGVAHAISNSAALALYTASLLARRGGRQRAGVALALAGGGAAIVGGYLGGHLTIVEKIGTGDASWYTREDPLASDD